MTQEVKEGAAATAAAQGAATAAPATEQPKEQAQTATATEAPPAEGSKDPAKTEAGSMVSGEATPEGKKESTDKEKAPKEATPAVPDKYELKLPEGTKLDAGYLAKVETLAKEKGWSNERAQEHIDERSAAIRDFEQQQRQELQQLNEKVWKEELMSHPEFGGKNFEQAGHLAYKAAEKFGGKEFADEIKAMGLNHHPKFFPFLYRVGKAMESDNIVITNQQSTGGKLPPERRMYPEMFQNKES